LEEETKKNAKLYRRESFALYSGNNGTNSYKPKRPNSIHLKTQIGK
jgi:hypothetical protein